MSFLGHFWPKKRMDVAYMVSEHSARNGATNSMQGEPISRILCEALRPPAIIPLRRGLLRGFSPLPADTPGRCIARLFEVASGGVWRATRVATRAVRSYRTISTLPVRALSHAPSAVCFLFHFPSARAAWTLSSTLPYEVRTFLSCGEAPAIARPALQMYFRTRGDITVI
jgi:hypothetical protein